uniref:hypothetical protein n=1 Tax=Methylibium rhizosphaerae TaxID=2570323 RepID=UPI0011280778
MPGSGVSAAYLGAAGGAVKNQLSISRYDAQGRLARQRLITIHGSTDGVDRNELTHDLQAFNYDDAGNLKGYVLKSHAGPGETLTTYEYDLKRFESYKEGLGRVWDDKHANVIGGTHYEYDANGQMFRQDD